MNISKAIVCGTLLAGGILSSNAAEGTIQGYFRVQNEGNQKYVEVTGPFTAKPNISEEDAQSSAGTVMYIEAVQNGDAYEVSSLRCQGIDVVGEPVSYEDYESILVDAASKDVTSLVYGMWQEGFKYGYTSFARAAVGSVFMIVAASLEGYQDGSDYTKEELIEIAQNFNRDVTASLDLGIRLRPVENKDNTVQLYFDVPSFSPVCEWYKNPDNYETFTAAMDAMRKWLAANGKNINLEIFYPADVQLFESWGYDVASATGVTESDGNVTALFPTIFSDPVLLFNWIKWVGYMILNPDCESAELHNMKALDISDRLGGLTNVKGHYLTDMLISYLPRLHYNTRAFLINGKVVGANGSIETGDTYEWDASADGTLGFANERELQYVANLNGNWVLVPVDNQAANGKLLLDLPESWTDENGTEKNYAAVYYDFPVSASDDSVTISTLSSAKNLYGYDYVTLQAVTGQVAARTAIVVDSKETQVQLIVADGSYTFSELDPDLFPDDGTVPAGSVPVTDEEITSQRVKRKAETSANNNVTGILLPTDYNRLQDYWDIDVEETPVYSLFTTEQVLSSEHLVFKASTENIAANQAIYVYPNLSNTNDMVIINAPEMEITVGETETGEEETKNQIKIAQGFNGEGSNIFEGLIQLPAELTFETDFTIDMTTMEDVDSDTDNWITPSNPDDIEQSYADAFEDIAGQYSILFSQYKSIFENASGETLDDVSIDGFFEDGLTASAESTGEVDKDGNYAYNLHFDAPCSGVYQFVIQGKGEYEGLTSGPHKVKIYPNLYSTFGFEKGFNIDGVQFQESNGKYTITLPGDGPGGAPYDLTNCIGYIPGTYFASSLTFTYGGVANKMPVRKVASDADWKYAVQLPDLTEVVKGSDPVTITVEKNGVQASYDFYIKQDFSTGVGSLDSTVAGNPVYYNLQGIRVSNPTEDGIYLKVENGTVTKQVVRK